MATRSLMALDYSDYHSKNILKKHAKNRPLGEIEYRHAYIPSQPVLSCRTVNIDLPGTRTYRPKSTIDILEEQQRLIRRLHKQQRASASAPPRPRADTVITKTPTDRRVNIEVKGRPLTSVGSNRGHLTETKPTLEVRKRPRTTGRLKHVQPATDCFMVVKVDKDLVATSQSNKELNHKIHKYWNSDSNNLAQGRFVRGQKRPDDVPPTLDAWLTFGGAAGDAGSEGVIDAFASFKNSEEFYNIEGSVGSRVAQQLQKGDKIRIGINGILQSQDLKVKKWKKESPESTDERGEDKEEEKPEEEEVKGEEVERKEDTNDRVEPEDDAIREEEEEEAEEEEGKEEKGDAVIAGNTVEEHVDEFDDFKELMIGNLDDFLLEDQDEADQPLTPRAPAGSPKVTSPPVPRSGVKASTPKELNKKVSVMEPPRETTPRVIVPLSWADQCTKPDVKVLHPTLSPRETPRPVMSETHPVKFEKLINGGKRPALAQHHRPDGYKVKQRPGSRPSESRGSSKVRVVYIDPLSRDEDEKVNSMSVEEIVHFKLDGRTPSRERVLSPLRSSLHSRGKDNVVVPTNEETGPPVRPPRTGSTRGGVRTSSRPNSNYSGVSERASMASPKLKTVPVHPSTTNPGQVDLSITAKGNPDLSNDNSRPHSPRSVKTPNGKLAAHKPLHKSGASQGSSIKNGPLQGETEFIKITKSLNVNGTSFSPAAMPNHHTTPSAPYEFSPGSNTPRDLDYQEPDFELGQFSPRSPPNEIASPRSNSDLKATHSSPDRPPNKNILNGQPLPEISTDAHSVKQDDDALPATEEGGSNKDEERTHSSRTESPLATTVAISIPTADELSDRESPAHSPSRRTSNDGLSPYQRRAKNLRDEQIDQITDLLGNAIVNS